MLRMQRTRVERANFPPRVAIRGRYGLAFKIEPYLTGTGTQAPHISTGCLQPSSFNRRGSRDVQPRREPMRSISLPVSICTLAAISMILPVSAASRYDGTWSVALTTERGACDAAYTWSVAVTNGRIGDNGPFVQWVGSVNNKGRVILNVIHGSDVVAAAGAIKGATGSGTWQSPTTQCSGRWYAVRSST